LNIMQFGKPSVATFSYAENVLMNYLDEWHGASQLKAGDTRAAPRRVYMLGDNPESGISLDIVG
jgi:ribonucleotide monophosphatase NagD (HAD superfamily)